MHTGIKFRAHPTCFQKLVISQWIGCARVIWNAKVAEEQYYRTYARKYCPIGTYAPIDQQYSRFKSKELTPWLFECPSPILRNAVANWYQTYQNFMKGRCGRPQHKPKTSRGSIYLTREMFRFDRCEDGNLRLFIGQKKNNIGYLSFKTHKKFKIPDSLHIVKEHGKYFICFAYDDGLSEESLFDNQEHLEYLKTCDREFLEEITVGIDRGVARPVQAGSQSHDFDPNQKKNAKKAERDIKHLQKQRARQQNGSKRAKKTKHRIAKKHAKIANIRKDFVHKTTRALVNSDKKVFILEDLHVSSMVRKPKSKQDANGRYLPNKAGQKAGLNKAILNVSWGSIQSTLTYKAKRAGKAVFYISAAYTSQECAKCGYTHPDNRKTQASFVCGNCGHTDNADHMLPRLLKSAQLN